MDLQQKAERAVKNCYWRKDLCGIEICTGNCRPCIRVIKDGKCQTLRELCKKERENNGAAQTQPDSDKS